MQLQYKELWCGGIITLKKEKDAGCIAIEWIDFVTKKNNTQRTKFIFVDSFYVNSFFLQCKIFSIFNKME